MSVVGQSLVPNGNERRPERIGDATWQAVPCLRPFTDGGGVQSALCVLSHRAS